MMCLLLSSSAPHFFALGGLQEPHVSKLFPLPDDNTQDKVYWFQLILLILCAGPQEWSKRTSLWPLSSQCSSIKLGVKLKRRDIKEKVCVLLRTPEFLPSVPSILMYEKRWVAVSLSANQAWDKTGLTRSDWMVKYNNPESKTIPSSGNLNCLPYINLVEQRRFQDHDVE